MMSAALASQTPQLMMTVLATLPSIHVACRTCQGGAGKRFNIGGGAGDVCSPGIPDASTDDDSVSHPPVHPCGVSDMKGRAGKRFNIGGGAGDVCSTGIPDASTDDDSVSHPLVHPCGVSDMKGRGR